MGSKNDIYKWIDLDALPKYTSGNHIGRIDWRSTDGCIIKFIYGDISGEIKILKYNADTRSLNIYIDGYTKNDYDVVYRETITKCSLGRILNKKIIDTASWMVQYLVDKNDALIYAPQSNQSTNTICPICGYTKYQIIANLYKYGFGCPCCSDGIHYPNKFMFNILKQIGIKFKPELSKKDFGFEWIENYRYDFYFKIGNNEYIVEMDGVFHFEDENVVKTDIIKNKLANEHNIEVIRIDCNYKSNNRFVYIKNNILNSKLNTILNFDNVDWELCNKKALNSLVFEICNYYQNTDNNISNISHIFNLDSCTVRKYLIYGSEIKICDYDTKQATIEKNNRMKESFGKPVSAFKDGRFIYTFSSRREASNRSKEILGRFFDPCTIGGICNGTMRPRYGFTFTNV